MAKKDDRYGRDSEKPRNEVRLELRDYEGDWDTEKDEQARDKNS